MRGKSGGALRVGSLFTLPLGNVMDLSVAETGLPGMGTLLLLSPHYQFPAVFTTLP